MIANEARTEEQLQLEDLRESWRILDSEERVDGFRALKREEAEDFFLDLPARDQADVLLALQPIERRAWMRLLPPDDAADLVQEAPADEREGLLSLLDEATRREVQVLLAYAEDDAGGLMNPRYARVRPDMSVDEAISYLRRQTREIFETVYYVYVLDADQRLLGVVSIRDVFSAPPDKRVRDIMNTDLVTIPEDMDQEAVSRLFSEHDFIAMPVVDADGRMKGIVTVDDIVDVVQEEATEDIQKIGGTVALGAPYLEVGVLDMLKKRGGWLAVLFLGEMLTATAMGRFEDEISRAVVLAVFVPLIISSGGNSGSQASTLIIRAMALGEVHLSDWWRVVRKELVSGAALGAALGLVGFLRVIVAEWMFHPYGPHYVKIAATIGLSLVGVVGFGTICGSMLPFLLRRLRLDPASASAPFVATLVDVTGIVIYFSFAKIFLTGALL